MRRRNTCNNPNQTNITLSSDPKKIIQNRVWRQKKQGLSLITSHEGTPSQVGEIPKVLEDTLELSPKTLQFLEKGIPLETSVLLETLRGG